MFENLTDKLLFKYYMADCLRKDSIFSTKPYYIKEKTAEDITFSAEILNNLSLKIIHNINNKFKDYKQYIPHFKHIEKLYSLNCEYSPLFWVRFDAFIKEEGGIFFSEFNYDKPCAQREIIVSEEEAAKDNLNKGFKNSFIKAFNNIIKNKFKDKKITVAVLIDPCHLEEARLSYLYKDILENENIKFLSVGPKNLSVKNNELFAFNSEKIDCLLRQFPTEFIEEINNIEEILELFDKDKLLILNDPRIIFAQCKTLYAYLWDLVKQNDPRISSLEKSLIINTLPLTKRFSIELREEALKNKDKYVLKPIFGRYSDDVFIGKLFDEEKWLEAVEYVCKNADKFILQEFCEIKTDSVNLENKYRVIPKKAFGNFGVYLIENTVKGFCTRWNETYLTCDDSTFITPIGKVKEFYHIKNYNLKDRKALWNKVCDEAAFAHNFTGQYSGEKEYISLASVILNKDKFEELKFASIELSKIFLKAQNLIKENIALFSSLLCIEGLEKIASQNYLNSLTMLGRMDWCLTTEGNLRLMEINSETPAGLVESIYISDIIKKELNIPYINPNKDMKLKLELSINNIIKEYSKVKEIKNIAILTSTYYEDWYNSKVIYDILISLGYNVYMGNIYDAKVKNEQIYLYGVPIDAVYRYYPLDWILKENKDMIKAFEKKTLCLNSPNSMISQSKGFLSIIFELKEQGFFTSVEADLIEKYLCLTSFDIKNMKDKDILVKPLLDREGNGVLLGCQLDKEPDFDLIFQQREDIATLNTTMYSVYKSEKNLFYPILGVYITNEDLCGIYTRLGELITTNCCLYSPLYLK